MALSSSQVQTIATYVQNDATLLAKLQQGLDNQVTAGLNAEATPDYWVWKTSVSELDIVSNESVDNTTFNWSALIARSVGEQFGWQRLFAVTGTVNPSKTNIRSAFSDIFSGSANSAPAQRTHLQAICRRKATVSEKALATGNGSSATPSLLTFEGNVIDSDIYNIAVVLGLR